jgi:hypothetical protein
MLLATHIFISPMQPKPSMTEAPWLIIPNEFDMIETEAASTFTAAMIAAWTFLNVESGLDI